VETVAFYSYKGGVGRSMLLANAAQYLARAGKGVVALDFDFEAPGLHYKLRGGPMTAGGAVPYLLATASGAPSPPPLDEHMTSVPVASDAGGWIQMMPAGPAPQKSYWVALKQLGDRLQLDDPSGRGIMAVLDLQARIADELKPDYLLIDARTGVTELGGLATTVLADTVVCMLVPNQESLDGTLTVAEALKSTPRLAGQKPIRVVPVLSRTMPTLSGDGRFAAGMMKLVALGGRPNLFVLPHDDELGSFEKLIEPNDSESSLYKAYIELFHGLFPASAPAGS
jgi:hypothetical protein